ncbi:hypothetical protein [Rugosimonospora africana]|uniref:Uncharacterized protein n=1 Tax=Rugosimonospora africana TaxID=556532 RepID=A0A8J3QT93_9ACTN|nr:hypothetical protein [Rugosimonospora africana]GIH16064.1 hypothetical protein Raf01_42360 [Rugosimonospora africana]
MRLYKEALRQRESSARLLNAERLTTYIDFTEVVDRWASAIGTIEMIDVDPDSDEAQRDPAVVTCEAAAAKANAVLTRFRLVHEEDAVRFADAVYSWILHWANDVVDGLWPSTHPGADQHHLFDLGFIESDLHRAVADEVGMSKDDLAALTRTEPRKLGGTGKRF